jgi:Pyruvate/2-oxoacid:ferredoxin oxidoreductase delta subunit
MSASAPALSRRAFLNRLLPSRRPVPPPPGKPTTTPPAAPVVVAPPEPTFAVIAGRHCLAYQHSFCSVCRERCPIAGAVIIERGIPRIDPSLCTGCRICHEVCPAPVNAIRLIPRPVAKSPA